MISQWIIFLLYILFIAFLSEVAIRTMRQYDSEHPTIPEPWSVKREEE